MIEAMDIFTVKNALRLVILVFLFGYVMFSLVLMLRMKILAQTLKTPRSPLIALLAKMHFLMVLIGSILVGFLIMF